MIVLASPVLFDRLVGGASVTPERCCASWDPGLLALNLGSDVVIAAAHVAIGAALVVLYVKTRNTLPHSGILPIFGTFILASGLVHVMAVVLLWYPLYWLAGYIKLVAAVAAVTAAIALPPLIPHVGRTIRDARRKRRSDSIFAAAVETSLDGIVILSARRGADDAIEEFSVQFANRPAREMFGLGTDADLLEPTLKRAFSRMPAFASLVEIAESDEALRTTVVHVTDAHQERWLEQLWIKFDEGLLLGVRDVTANKVIEGQAIAKGLADPLTGLPNRTQLEERIEEALDRALAARTSVGLIFVDIDDFKDVNDRHGHVVGDAVLREAATRLAAAVRESDVVFRYAGDEFVILVYGTESPDELTVLAHRLIEQFDAPVVLKEGLRLQIGISAGGAVACDRSADPTTLIQRADEAMYQAKRNGRHRPRFTVFDPRLDNHARALPLPRSMPGRPSRPAG